MTRIEAHADAVMIFRCRQDVGNLLERRAERRALSGRVLEEDHGLPALARGEQLDEARGDEIEAGFLTSRR